jgi:hypothetical protein
MGLKTMTSGQTAMATPAPIHAMGCTLRRRSIQRLVARSIMEVF